MIFNDIILFNPEDISKLFENNNKTITLYKHIQMKEKCIDSFKEYEMHKRKLIGNTLLDNTGDFDVKKLVKLDAYLTELIKPEFIFFLKERIADMDQKKRTMCSSFSNYCVVSGIHQEEIVMAMMLRLINVDPSPNYKKFKIILNDLNDLEDYG